MTIRLRASTFEVLPNKDWKRFQEIIDKEREENEKIIKQHQKFLRRLNRS